MTQGVPGGGGVPAIPETPSIWVTFTPPGLNPPCLGPQHPLPHTPLWGPSPSEWVPGGGGDIGDTPKK